MPKPKQPAAPPEHLFAGARADYGTLLKVLPTGITTFRTLCGQYVVKEALVKPGRTQPVLCAACQQAREDFAHG